MSHGILQQGLLGDYYGDDRELQYTFGLLGGMFLGKCRESYRHLSTKSYFSMVPVMKQKETANLNPLKESCAMGCNGHQ